METGKYYQANQRKTEQLVESDWKVALAQCKEHIRWRLRQRTLSGAHSASSLGADPIDHYLGIAYEKILLGEWEWKDEHTLAQQMIRIADSYISKGVAKATSAKGEAFKIIYKNVEEEFYDLAAPPADEQEQHEIEQRLKMIETAVVGDEHLEFMIEGLKEGKKRADIAELLNIGVRQLDKLREKLMRRIQNQQQPSKK
ncbi:hypothetical protein [Mucilaginibacter sp. 22184]|uniref:hypothetical protein n=1 Tax=Mucilaginibacter sp. 22184 TaxID=3453887 RepID=UPI003F8624D4